MSSSDLSIEQIFQFFKENGNQVKNRELVHHFKPYLTHPASKDDARTKFKQYVNTLALTQKTEEGEKYLCLKTKYLNGLESLRSVPPSPQNESINSVGIPVSPSTGEPPSPLGGRQPPPYRPPPPVTPSPNSSIGNISLGSQEVATPTAPPRRKSAGGGGDGGKFVDEECKQSISVRERTEKFNRLISVEDELSPRPPKSEQKNKPERKEVDEEDGASITSLDPKKCIEWCVTASRGDFQELIKLANGEPRLVHKKDPFSAYTVLHWGAKHGNVEIIKSFAGRYKVDVNGKTNGGYTPLHISAQYGHRDIFKLLIEVYKADTKIRDNSGRLAEYYLILREQKGRKQNISKIKCRKKQSEKDLSFLRMGSLNVRVKKTTEAFSNFLGVGTTPAIYPLEPMTEKKPKGWGSVDNLNDNAGPKSNAKKKFKRPIASGLVSTPTTPRQIIKVMNPQEINDSDSDTAAGFDSQWKN